jgi:transposase
MTRGLIRLTDKQWTKIRPHLPKARCGPKGGRPRAPDRATLEGILWVLRTGARWKDLPSEYPSPSTCWRRLRDWEQQGVWLKLWRVFLTQLDRKGKLDWEEAFADGSFAAAKKGATASATPAKAKVQSGWWWEAARVFLWEFTSTRPPRRK